MDKHGSLLRKLVTYGRKKFYSIGPRWERPFSVEQRGVFYLGRLWNNLQIFD
jgi:hypothetical protein